MMTETEAIINECFLVNLMPTEPELGLEYMNLEVPEFAPTVINSGDDMDDLNGGENPLMTFDYVNGLAICGPLIFDGCEPVLVPTTFSEAIQVLNACQWEKEVMMLSSKAVRSFRRKGALMFHPDKVKSTTSGQIIPDCVGAFIAATELIAEQIDDYQEAGVENPDSVEGIIAHNEELWAQASIDREEEIFFLHRQFANPDDPSLPG